MGEKASGIHEKFGGLFFLISSHLPLKLNTLPGLKRIYLYAYIEKNYVYKLLFVIYLLILF